MKRYACLLCIVLWGGGASAYMAAVDLTGQMKGSDGAPIEGARIHVHEAAPSAGPGTACSSCYLDCLKSARTDAEGRFRIEALDSTLVFTLLAVAPGHETRLIRDVDPAQGACTIEMSPRGADILASPYRIAGMVMGPTGRPVRGAEIQVTHTDGKGSWQPTADASDLDPVGITDENGEFVLRCSERYRAIYAQVDGPGAARKQVRLLPGKDHLVRMDEGAMLTGRLDRDGRPLAGVAVRVMAASDATNRSRQFEPVATDTQGLFILPNLPANASYVLFPTLDSMNGRGAVPTRIVRTAENGSTTDVGRIAADPGFRLAGQVVLSDDRPVPPDAQLLIGREDAWDILFAPLDDQGRFDVPSLPAEALVIAPYVEIEDYTLSPENIHLDPQQGALVIHPDRDMPDLVILLEPKRKD